MRFSPAFLDELRERLSVSEVVGKRVKLHKAGREWKGLSPFNKEKTPSFFVNDQKAMWFDFSSGRRRGCRFQKRWNDWRASRAFRFPKFRLRRRRVNKRPAPFMTLWSLPR